VVLIVLGLAAKGRGGSEPFGIFIGLHDPQTAAMIPGHGDGILHHRLMGEAADLVALRHAHMTSSTKAHFGIEKDSATDLTIRLTWEGIQPLQPCRCIVKRRPSRIDGERMILGGEAQCAPRFIAQNGIVPSCQPRQQSQMPRHGAKARVRTTASARSPTR
jgi:hypothetical protein